MSTKPAKAMPLSVVPARVTGAPNIMQGDDVYVQHPDLGVLSAPVASVGRDGCHIQHAQHGLLPMRWDQILGFKKRAQRNLTVLEQGEDGAIALDENGQRVYIRGELPIEDAQGAAERMEGEMRKALAPWLSGPPPAADLRPLANALTAFGSSWLKQLRQHAVRFEAADIRREALDVQLQQTQAAFVGALASIVSAQAQERAAFVTELARLSENLSRFVEQLATRAASAPSHVTTETTSK